jgi:hypothetical protein
MPVFTGALILGRAGAKLREDPGIHAVTATGGASGAMLAPLANGRDVTAWIPGSRVASLRLPEDDEVGGCQPLEGRTSTR